RVCRVLKKALQRGHLVRVRIEAPKRNMPDSKWARAWRPGVDKLRYQPQTRAEGASRICDARLVVRCGGAQLGRARESIAEGRVREGGVGEVPGLVDVVEFHQARVPRRKVRVVPLQLEGIKVRDGGHRHPG